MEPPNVCYDNFEMIEELERGGQDDFCFVKMILNDDYAMMAGTKIYIASDIFELLPGRHQFESGTEQATIERIKVNKSDKLPDFVPRELKELDTAMMVINVHLQSR
ncbi:MAG: hypothetical protein EZS28_016768 [Streblomastix strix]|uniref:Uncharacterized protein n=1 Tax=Streblomastix strix TaxID=222440 RepID=A0A5J4VYJ8_9EUKA|nr:MAG: hypothetical protein EZS28_016768 [Streblomastix strix]